MSTATEYHVSYRLARTEEVDGRLQLVDEEAAQFKAWREAHGAADVPREILPELGIVARLDGEDAAAGWLYRMQGVSLGLIYWMTSRPGLSLSDARQAFAGLMRGVEEIAKEVGVTVILGCAGAAVAREACRSLGFMVFEREHYTILKGLPQHG